MSLKPLTDYNFKMKVIKDLGMKKPTENYYKKVRMAVFECTHCKKHFETVVSKKAESQRFCKECLGVAQIKGNRDHPLYKIWTGTRAKLKCTNKHANCYLSKGITMCTEWDTSFEAFFEWSLANGYKPGLTIGRIDNDGNYTPENCRWIDWSTQICNQRPLKCTNTTGYKGISLYGKKYTACIKYHGKRYNLGSFNSKIEAAKAYDSMVALMKWPHSTNKLLAPNEIVYPTNKSTVNFLLKQGIQCSNTLSKKP